jgi:hypothetical protein
MAKGFSILINLIRSLKQELGGSAQHRRIR